MIFKNLIVMGAILLNLFLIFYSHKIWYILSTLLILYVYNNYDSITTLVLFIVTLCVVLKSYSVENFDCVSNSELISTNARTMDCQTICKNREDCKYMFQPFNESNKPRDCYVGFGLGKKQIINLDKCKDEKMIPWLNTKFKGAREKLLLNTSDKGFRNIYIPGNKFNAVGGMNRKRFRFKNAYITKIEIKRLQSKDQGWGYTTPIRTYGVKPDGSKILIAEKYCHSRDNRRACVKEYRRKRFHTYNHVFKLDEQYNKGNIFNEIFVRPRFWWSGHSMTYGGIDNIKVWGYEV